MISIHALREEGDEEQGAEGAEGTYFYPRPPRGGRPGHAHSDAPCKDFYPRPPRGGRRRRQFRRCGFSGFLSTPSARRATGPCVMLEQAALISIHALREEGDAGRASSTLGAGSFLSTPSARRATDAARHPATAPTYFYPRPPRGGRRKRCPIRPHDSRISIHALREEGDPPGSSPEMPTERFLSTPSARRATVTAGVLYYIYK